MKKFSKLIFIFLFSFITVACSSVKLNSTLRKDIPEPYGSYKIVNVSNNSNIDPQVAMLFENALRERLQEYGYKEGDEVTISYNINAFDPGNRALRMFVGFGLGKGTLSVQTTLKDKSGQPLGAVNSETALRMGFFGGSLNNVIKATAVKVAAQIHKAYVMNNY